MPDHLGGRLADGMTGRTSRRGFMDRVGKALLVLTGGSAVAAAVDEPDDAQGYHFCGHIYTTASCPHPTGLPRIDRRGYPLRAKDGRPVDDLGRRIDSKGRPLTSAGKLRRDPDGRALPPAPRSRICQDGIKRKYRINARIDGSWSRCCGGQVRKLMDCCTYSKRRINGDRALTGYCYAGRKVFCVMYYDTKIPC
jgi:hypothetical protein